MLRFSPEYFARYDLHRRVGSEKKRRVKVLCECGCEVRRDYKKRHEATKKHERLFYNPKKD